MNSNGFGIADCGFNNRAIRNLQSQIPNRQMKTDVKKLRLGDVILHRRGSFALWLIHFIFGVSLSIFFRKIELTITKICLKQAV